MPKRKTEFSDLFSPKVMAVIRTTTARGEGTKEDTMRTVVQYHTLQGEFLAENDPVTEEST